MEPINAQEKKILVLVVDDEAGICQSVGRILARRGYEVEQAPNAAVVIDGIINGKRYDLIIADLMMPKVGGLELLKVVKQIVPAVPILMITGYPSIAAAVEAAKRGAAGLVPKPFTPDELEKAVEQALVQAPPAPADAGLEEDPAARSLGDGGLSPVAGPGCTVPSTCFDLAEGGRRRKAVSAVKAPRVLVVDDEAVVANSIRRILTRRGYEVVEAFAGSDVLDRLAVGSFDLVLLDMKLGGENGLDLLDRIKLDHPDLPVVMVTGYASMETAMDAIQHGAADYMAKPFTPEELFGVTRRILAGSAA